MKRSLKTIKIAFRQVFAHPSYGVLAGFSALFAFLFAVWLPNFSLIGELFGNPGTPLAAKIKIAASLIGSIRTNFSVFSASYTLLIALLFGANVALIAYGLRRTRKGLGAQGLMAGLGGTASGALGTGCAACGSFILNTTLSSFGAAGALAILPLRGGEFGILSILLLVFSLWFISKKIAAPNKKRP